MALTKYSNQKIGAEKLAVIDQANQICREYANQGLSITLRQLYYQFVARGWLPENTQQQYKRIGDICADARMCGLMDWDYLIDRTRNLAARPFWSNPEEMLQKSAEQYHKDLWKPQRKRVEVWVEKDAAVGVIQGVCRTNSVSYFSTRGYGSISEYHAAAQRVRWYIERGEQVTILHIGDHDPSGVDMTRDIEDRLRQFIAVDYAGINMGLGAWTRGDIRRHMQRHLVAKYLKATEREEDPEPLNEDILDSLQNQPPWQVKRIALTLDQVEEYGPPPNFAKESDSRHRKYVEQTGMTDSWELDALDPPVLIDLIQSEIDAIRDEDLWMEADADMEDERALLTATGQRWADVKALVAPEEKS